MSFDLLTLFEETEMALAKLEEGDESAAEEFAKYIFALRPSYVSGTSYLLYQEDAAARYAQWILSINRELGITLCLEALHQFADKFWPSNMPAITEAQVKQVFQMVNQVFPYTQKVSPEQPIEILLFDARHETLNGETTAFFEPSGMRGCICMYRMQEETLSPVAVFLHELGHLLHIRGTGAMDQVPPSFVTYLRRLGAQTDALTIPQLQDVFADTFMLAVMSQHPELEVPIPGLSDQVLRAGYQYIQAFFDEIA